LGSLWTTAAVTKITGWVSCVIPYVAAVGAAWSLLTAEWPEPFALVAVHSSVDVSETDRKRSLVRAQCFPSYQLVSSPPHHQVDCRLAATPV